MRIQTVCFNQNQHYASKYTILITVQRNAQSRMFDLASVQLYSTVSIKHKCLLFLSQSTSLFPLFPIFLTNLLLEHRSVG